MHGVSRPFAVSFPAIEWDFAFADLQALSSADTISIQEGMIHRRDPQRERRLDVAKSRNRRGMGPLLKEMRTSPVAAAVNGVLGVGGILGGGIVIALLFARAVRKRVPGQATTEGSLLLFAFLIGLFLLGGIGFLLFALVQLTTRTRVFGKGMVRHRFGNKRVVLWVEVDHFGVGGAAATSLTSWSMLLRNGERIDFHSGLYYKSEFAETMELIAEQIEDTHRQLG
jgi:hypothetical protein